tara:strand:- start:33 stop:1058 length:1026 start_codon:yes stop_codon:yes gene_type:complete
MKYSLIYLITALLFSGNPENIYYDPNKLHHTPDGFTNPYLNINEQDKKFSDLFKMMREDRPNVSEMLDVIKVSKKDIQAHIKAKKNFYLWIGHSTALIHINGKNILTDPIFSDRCSPIKFAGPKRYSEPAISIEDLPMIDLIVISHNHYDHLDYKTVKKIGDNALWIVPLGLKKWFFNQGVENVKEMDWYDSFNQDGIEVVSLPSQHWSKRTVFKSFDTLWSSWSIKVDDFKFWFAGDTGYNDIQFKEIGKDYGPFDLAAIPIGAYEPRWFMKNFHINPEEAVQIHQEIFSKLSVGIHFGTFILTTEPIEEPILKLQEAINKYNLNPKEFLAIGIGEFIFL